MTRLIPEPKLKALYQEVILDHNRRPRNYGELPDATQYSHAKNPLCGDDYHLYLKVSPVGVVEKITFTGSGCAISKSSASMLTTLVAGKSLAEALKLSGSFLEFMTKEPVSKEIREGIDRMTIFEGVKEFPIRVKCATLAWHALGDALQDASKR